MSYTAEKMDTDLAAGGWQVNCPGEDPIADLDEAMAHIIAFALTAISNGQSLMAVTFDGQIRATGSFDASKWRWVEYDGPTEGIAP